MSKNIFITRRIPDIAEKMLREKGYDVDVYPKDHNISQDKLIRFLKKKSYDAVLSLITDKIDAKVFDAAPTVKIYANYATGYDNFDLGEAKRRGITMANAPASRTPHSVAEHTFGLLLALAKRIPEAHDFVCSGKYKGWVAMQFMTTDIGGKTLGLVGVGRIGETVARLALAIGLKVIYYDVIRNEGAESQGVGRSETIEELLKEADFVSLHVPLLDSTRHLMNAERLAHMKPTAFIINTSRGPVIDEMALDNALRQGQIAGAALDVYEFEPRVCPGLKKLPNVILTPHIASATIETRKEMAVLAAQNIIDFLESGAPKYIVNR